MVLGFIDADGGIEAKVSFGTIKPVSFHVNVILCQKDRSVIKMCLDALECAPNEPISTRTPPPAPCPPAP